MLRWHNSQRVYNVAELDPWFQEHLDPSSTSHHYFWDSLDLVICVRHEVESGEGMGRAFDPWTEYQGMHTTYDMYRKQ